MHVSRSSGKVAPSWCGWVDAEHHHPGAWSLSARLTLLLAAPRAAEVFSRLAGFGATSTSVRLPPVHAVPVC